MSKVADFAAQLHRCGQDRDEVRNFVEAFSKVRLRYIIRALTMPPTTQLDGPTSKSKHPPQPPVKPDWTDTNKLVESGLTPTQIAASSSPDNKWLHVDVAMDSRSRQRVDRFLTETCLSDKQRRALFPGLSAYRFSKPEVAAQRLGEVPRLNAWLAWVRAEGMDVGLIDKYQRHLGIHGASQNAGGDVGAVGGAIAVMDALSEISPSTQLNLLGVLPPPGQRDPLSVDAFLRGQGIDPASKERPLKCVLLPNSRAIVFASDPDVAVIQSLQKPFKTAGEAWEAYSAVRSDATARTQRLMEFVVGEVKTATDPSNLHERLALGSRESRSERKADRFLMMAILTEDILVGSSGKNGKKNTRAPLQSLEANRFTDIFNLHHAWGWDGGRDRHPEHWKWLKLRLKTWCGL